LHELMALLPKHTVRDELSNKDIFFNQTFISFHFPNIMVGLVGVVSLKNIRKYAFDALSDQT